MSLRVTEVGRETHSARHEERIFEIRNEAIGMTAFLALIEGQIRPAFGGIRRREFANPQDAKLEARLLAKQMLLKIAFAELPNGAAKVVLIDSSGLDLRAAYANLGRAIESLNGRYFSGPDVGTGKQELAWLAGETTFVNHKENDPGVATALGVAAGLDAAVGHLGWTSALVDRVVLIQGLGSVGHALAELLAAKGARLRLCDLDHEKAKDVAASLTRDGREAQVVAATDLDRIDADVFCPCALGDVLDKTSARFKIVCGSANLQSGDRNLVNQLHDQGCLIIPEITINAGAVIEGIFVQSKDDATVERAQARGHILETKNRVNRLLAGSQQLGVSPQDAVKIWQKEFLQ